MDERSTIEPYWQSADGGARLYLGEARDVCPLFADPFDHTITDPPYEAEAHTKQRRVKRPVKGNTERIALVEALSFPPILPKEREAMAGHVARLTRRWALTFCQIEASHLWRASYEAAGMGYKRTCIWVKPDGMPQLTGDRPGMGYETFVAVHAPVVGRSRWNGGGRVGVFEHMKRSYEENIHPTQKPESLMIDLVETFTDPGETIFDPFAGSGTTGIACMRAKGGPRRFVGVERDEKFAEKAARRLEAEAKGSTYHAQERGQRALFG